MTLQDLGYNEEIESSIKQESLEAFIMGRVISEHKERYIVKTPEKEYNSEIIGNLRFSAISRADFPAVGDWVAISEFNDNDALIHKILPRITTIERQSVGKHAEKQIIATNIDFALIVQAVDRDFNINRLERYLTICYNAHVSPIIILNKTDLINEVELMKLVEHVRNRVKEVPIMPISNISGQGIKQLEALIIRGKTYCLLGSSGVGKSSLLNVLSGSQIMKTDAISESNNKGRHVTSHRELILLENGGIIIDNPGMREVGVTDSSEGVKQTFEAIYLFAEGCKFKDCKHVAESGCAVLAALENGELDESSYHNYMKVEREKEFFESSVAEKRRKDKAFGKMVKNVMKMKKK